MRGLITYFIKYPVSGNTLMFLTLIFGLIALSGLKSTFFPPIESRFIQIQVMYPGSSPEEIEEGIIQKIENNLKGITGIDRVTSISMENAGSVTVEVLETYDPDIIIQDVRNAVDRISSFPAGMEPPVIFRMESLNFSISFAVSGDVPLRALKESARRIESDLLRVEGISKVTLSGFPEEEIVVLLNEESLKSYQISIAQVAAAVRAANLDVTGGIVKNGQEELLIRSRNKEYEARELEYIVVKAMPDGRMVHLRDLAQVENRWADNPNRSWLNSKPSVTILVQNTPDEDILFIASEIKKYIAAFNSGTQGIEAKVVRDGSVVLQQRIDLLLKNGGIGAILVLILLSVFLNPRVSFWVAVSIPVSFCGMFIAAAWYGLTINVISLFGMILVIGILVDDGIIIAENIFQHYEKGKAPLKAAIDGTMEVIGPVTSAILTTVIAFSAFFFMSGNIGSFMVNMAFVVIGTLLFSLVEAAFILPAHIAHSKGLQEIKNPNRVEKFFNAVMDWLKFKAYAPVLRFGLKYKALTIVGFIGVFYVSISAISGGIVKTTIFPFVEGDAINVDVEMPAGTQAEITERWMEHIEQAAWTVNDSFSKGREDGKQVILDIERRVGPGAEKGSLEIVLLDGESRNVKSFVIGNAIREQAGPIYGAQSTAFGVRTPFGKAISISLMGRDMEQLALAKEDLKLNMSSIKAIRDITDSDQEGIKEVRIRLRENAALLGLTNMEVMSQVRQAWFGNEVQRLQKGLDEVRIWVRYGDEERKDLSAVEDFLVRTPSGGQVPLREIADLTIDRGIMRIQHIDGQREVRIEADLADPTQAVPDILNSIENNILKEIISLYPGVSYSFEGQSRESSKTGKSAARIMPVILLLMLAIIALTFRSFGQAFLVFAMIPFGFIGVTWGHWIHSSPISMLSAYGMLALLGIMVNDSLVFVSTINVLLREGKSFRDAVYQGALSRFRPIVLTSVTTIAGLGPLILEKSFQAQFLIPMAISVAYGLAVATVITLILLPVSLVVLNRLRLGLARLRTGSWKPYEEVEPAVREIRVFEKYMDQSQIKPKGGKRKAPLLFWPLMMGALCTAPVKILQGQSFDRIPGPTMELSLDQAMNQALEHNHGILMSRNRTQIQENLAQPGQAGLLPRISGTGSAGYSLSDSRLELAGGNGTIDAQGAESVNYGASIGASYTWFNGLQAWKNYRKLQLNAGLARIQEQIAVENTMVGVIAAYYELARRQEGIQLSKEAVETSMDRFSRMQSRFRLGGVSRVEMLGAEVDLNSDSLSLLLAIQQKEEAQRNLAHLLGLPATQTFLVRKEVQLQTLGIMQEYKEQALSRNNQILAADKGQDLAFMEARLARAQHFPRLDGNLSYGSNTNRNEGSFITENSNTGLTAGLTLALPIFDGGRVRRQKANAQLLYQNAQLSAEQTRLQVERDIENAWGAYLNARSSLELQERSVKTAELNFERAAELYQLGQLNGNQYREAQLNVLRARQGLLFARYQAKLMEYEIIRLSGGFEADED